MKIKDLFRVTNTDQRNVTVRDRNGIVVWRKEAGEPTGKIPFLESEISWIYRIDSVEIEVQIERIKNE